LTPEEIQMMMSMGIPFGFDTTQGKKVEDEAANAGAIKIKTTRTARQYMNRKVSFSKNIFIYQLIICIQIYVVNLICFSALMVF
jgi:hypothetical protein